MGADALVLVRALVVLLGLAAAGLTGFGLGVWISSPGPDWRDVFDATDPSDEAAA